MSATLACFLALLSGAAAATWDGRVGHLWFSADQTSNPNQNPNQNQNQNSNPYYYDHVYPPLIGQPGQQLPKRLAKVQLIRTQDNSTPQYGQIPRTSYYGVVGVGEPAKPFLVQFDTRTSDIWLPRYTWNPFASNLHYSKGYDKDDSSTYDPTDVATGNAREYTVQHRGTALTGSPSSDVLTLGYRGDTIMPNNFPSLPVAPVYNVAATPSILARFRQRFLAIHDASNDQFKRAPFDGVIGLAPVAQSSTGTTNILLSMQGLRHAGPLQLNAANGSQLIQPDGQSSPIDADVYYQFYQEMGLQEESVSMWFNTLLDSRYGGELIFGGVDEAHYVGQIYYHNVMSWFEWQLHTHYVMLANEIISCPTGCSVTLDTGENDIIGPREAVQRLYALVGSEPLPGTNIQLVDCNSIGRLPTMSFLIDNIPYALLPSHYIRRAKTLATPSSSQPVDVCYVAVRAHEGENDDSWVLGVNFLTAYYTAFDFRNRRIGFATRR